MSSRPTRLLMLAAFAMTAGCSRCSSSHAPSSSSAPSTSAVKSLPPVASTLTDAERAAAFRHVRDEPDSHYPEGCTSLSEVYPGDETLSAFKQDAGQCVWGYADASFTFHELRRYPMACTRADAAWTSDNSTAVLLMSDGARTVFELTHEKVKGADQPPPDEAIPPPPGATIYDFGLDAHGRLYVLTYDLHPSDPPEPAGESSPPADGGSSLSADGGSSLSADGGSAPATDGGSAATAPDAGSPPPPAVTERLFRRNAKGQWSLLETVELTSEAELGQDVESLFDPANATILENLGPRTITRGRNVPLYDCSEHGDCENYDYLRDRWPPSHDYPEAGRFVRLDTGDYPFSSFIWRAGHQYYDGLGFYENGQALYPEAVPPPHEPVGVDVRKDWILITDQQGGHPRLYNAGKRQIECKDASWFGVGFWPYPEVHFMARIPVDAEHAYGIERICGEKEECHFVAHWYEQNKEKSRAPLSGLTMLNGPVDRCSPYSWQIHGHDANLEDGGEGQGLLVAQLLQLAPGVPALVVHVRRWFELAREDQIALVAPNKGRLVSDWRQVGDGVMESYEVAGRADREALLLQTATATAEVDIPAQPRTWYVTAVEWDQERGRFKSSRAPLYVARLGPFESAEEAEALKNRQGDCYPHDFVVMSPRDFPLLKQTKYSLGKFELTLDGAEKDARWANGCFLGPATVSIAK